MNNNSMKIAVIGGAGHVGLPLSLMLSKKGFPVTLIDSDTAKIEMLKKGEFPFLEEGGIELLKEVKDKIIYSTEHSSLSICDAVILTVGTPVDEHLNPKIKPVFEVIDQIKPYLHDDQVIVLRSTLFPGLSEKILAYLRTNGLNVGVSFCPERIAQGKGLVELPNTPQIVSASDGRTLKKVKSLFSAITPHIIELSMTEAELAKLFSNAWRYIKFAVANQFYMVAVERGLDFYKIREAMIFEFDRCADFPKSGFAAGPCLFKDTMQLAAYNRQLFPLGNAAMLINETMPDFLVEHAKSKHSLSGQKVGVLGMAFKADNDDIRESLAYKLRKLLQYEGAAVMCTDPYIKDETFFPLEKVLESCEVLFIACPHAEYRHLDLMGKEVFDCWGLYPDRI